MMEELGVVDTDPLVAPPVLKLVPVQEVALAEVQLIVVLPPVGIMGGLTQISEVVQGGVLQGWVSTGEPEQLAPPYAGAGLVQVLVLVWVPVCPQAVTEQALQALQEDQPPLTGVRQAPSYQPVPLAQDADTA